MAKPIANSMLVLRILTLAASAASIGLMATNNVTFSEDNSKTSFKVVIAYREEIFVTSKLWNNNAHHDLVLPALRKTLQKLGLEYVDLYLIHWPVRLKQEVEGFNFSKEDILPFDIKSTWEAMEKCHSLGLAKSIGVSNFGTKKLSQLLENATIPPAVNQVEMNPSWQQTKLTEFCKQKGIHNPVLEEIAIARKKSVAQIALRWIHEQEASAIVKSFNEERMKQNLEIFDWELTRVELEKISLIPQRRLCKAEMYVSENGPYKSLEELWDGDP
ncbi:methylecgonone reductase-like [Quillaja saponaria]|uniref:Methylecgonone reductase-like n=1 Tax=Quillaja saponaria TaxID=32244 RepID=A0AAD7Q5N4_QUISA|nr:methylecgonone reductase-like [Quillaja saponaria]